MAASVIPGLGLGFLLGLTHALEADHVAAVGTLVSESRGLRRSSLLGASWGVGHSLSLLGAGLLVLGLRFTIPPRFSAAAEFAVGFMLVGLGARAIWKVLREKRLHWHVEDTSTSTPTESPTAPRTPTPMPFPCSGDPSWSAASTGSPAAGP